MGKGTPTDKGRPAGKARLAGRAGTPSTSGASSSLFSSRQGPRPLPLHLTAQAMTLLSSRAASPFLSSGSLPWRPELAKAGADLASEVANVPPDAFAAALDAEIQRRFETFMAGVRAYHAHPYKRALPKVPVAWSEGTTRLLDYGGPAGAPAVVLVPSLINRAYILDLSERFSLARYLVGRGLRTFLVDWGAPGDAERGFTLDDYITGRLDRAVAHAAAEAGGRPPVLAGYCMGGVLALGLAHRRPDAVKALALLATPWDFHADRGGQVELVRACAPWLSWVIDTLGVLPVDVIQALFSGLDPLMTVRKFTAFAALGRNTAKARNFVALEDWLNDGVALAGPVARECLFGWYGANTTALGRWRLEGAPVLPEEVPHPALVLLPQGDRIVPPRSAENLASRLPGATVRRVPTGHIGMMTGRRVRGMVYRPLATWLARAGEAP